VHYDFGSANGSEADVTHLQEKTAIVTGAGRGVGRAIAVKLGNEGANVVVNDLDAIEANQTAETIGGNAMAFPGDVTDPDFPQALVTAAIDRFRGIDIIVNNAGYIWNGAMHNHSDEQWQAMLDVHVTAPFRILRAFAPWLRATTKQEVETRGGPICRKVVNISSISGTEGAATQIAYSAGKAAVIGMTKTLAKEWGRYNVTVNAVAFGHIDTRLTQAYDGQPPTIDVAGRAHRVGLTTAQIDATRGSRALERIGTPDDAAGAIYLFCIPESDYVTGQVLTCSGGV